MEKAVLFFGAPIDNLCTTTSTINTSSSNTSNNNTNININTKRPRNHFRSRDLQRFVENRQAGQQWICACKQEQEDTPKLIDDSDSTLSTASSSSSMDLDGQEEIDYFYDSSTTNTTEQKQQQQKQGQQLVTRTTSDSALVTFPSYDLLSPVSELPPSVDHKGYDPSRPRSLTLGYPSSSCKPNYIRRETT